MLDYRFGGRIKAKGIFCKCIQVPDSRAIEELINKTLQQYPDYELLPPHPILSGSYYNKREGKNSTIYSQILWFYRGDTNEDI
uniref:Uncharacterized protein n=1 Tax=viral metagenome TaxID=1070528 RepID=A0A6M3X6J6_9ZZZZ